MGQPAEVIIYNGYDPRPHQWELHDNRKRFNVFVCHRRFGKTVACINELIRGAAECEKVNPRFAYICPLYKQAKQVAWDYLKMYTAEIPGHKVNESELRVDLPGGARIQLFGADNPDALRGIYLDGAVLDEYAQMSPRLWSEVIRPLLSDRKGWCIFIGTPMGHNAFFDMYEYAQEGSNDWLAAMYKVSETKIIDAEELADAKRTMGEDEYAQEFECSFEAAIRGAYYGKIMADLRGRNRMCVVPYQKNLKVHTAWDIGVGDPTAIWFFQQAGQEIHLIDYYESTDVGVEHYIHVLQQKPYIYGDHWAPHDVKAREWGTGKSRAETAKSLGIKFKVAPDLRVDDGIQAARLILERCWFDADNCKDGIEALTQYRKDWDDQKQVFKPHPLHDWCSHGADAFRYLAVSIKDRYLPPKPRFERTFNELLAEHDQAFTEERI